MTEQEEEEIRQLLFDCWEFIADNTNQCGMDNEILARLEKAMGPEMSAMLGRG